MARTRLVVMAVLLALVGSLVISEGSASAAPSIWCDKNGAAPTVGASGGVVTGYYSHVCNSVAGVTRMVEDLTIERRDVGSSTWGQFESDFRDYTRTRVDFTVSREVLRDHGYFRPQMFLTITGTFSFGKVPGCGRFSSTQVTCKWYGVERYF
jgi:hypothetical protein